MELTETEKKEREFLEEMQQNGTRFMTQDDHNRLSYLRQKTFHNCCSNPHCTGYTGTNEETECPKCKSKLFKFNDMED